jgi:hypothetical protein
MVGSLSANAGVVTSRGTASIGALASSGSRNKPQADKATIMTNNNNDI